MRITKIEVVQLLKGTTVHVGSVGWLWVRIHTSDGLVGLGETFPAVAAEKAVVLGDLAPVLIGRDPTDIEALWRDMFNAVQFRGWGGAEIRAISAVDLALWDLLGKAANLPVFRLLGGRCWESIRVYNTCYDDKFSFLTQPVELARDLAARGIRGMKIWPFDEAAEASNGTDISGADLKRALQPFEQIRKAVGERMDIHVEFHSLWQLPAAIRIAQALEPFQPYWYEDPIKMNNLDALADYARRTRVWVTASETLGTRWAFRELFQKQAVSVCMLDVGWTGGLSEAKKIATMAEAYALPVAPHDCTGPVLLTASVHLAMNCPNTLVQEVVRAFYYDWYGKLVTELPPIEQGTIRAPAGPGLGTRLQPGIALRKDARVKVSKL